MKQSRPNWKLLRLSRIEKLIFHLGKFGNSKMLCHVIEITVYAPSFLGQGTVKWPFILRWVKEHLFAHLSIRQNMEASHRPFYCWTSSRKAVKTNFSSLLFNPTGNRTHVYGFTSRCSIYSTTEIWPISAYSNQITEKTVEKQETKRFL